MNVRLIEELVGAVTSLIATKYIMNDVPHALGLLAPYSLQTSNKAWEEVLAFMEANNVRLRTLYEQWVERLPPSWEHLAKDYRDFMSGYYLLATGRATDEIVDELYTFSKTVLQTARRSLMDVMEVKRLEDVSPTTFPWVTKFRKLFEYMRNGTRADKVIAIDATVHFEHDQGLLLAYYFRLTWWELLQEPTFRFLELLAGRNISQMAACARATQ